MKVDLLTPVQLGGLQLSNRMVMAPMSRARAEGGIMRAINAEYYAQRASFGLIVTEATVVSADALIMPNCPGIFSDEQLHGWKRVTDAVHARGGKIFMQLTHPGRMAYPLPGKIPLAPSGFAAQGQIFAANGWEDCPTPAALDASGINKILRQFASGARNALAAGFDGIELQGGSGHLVDQFLQNGSNRRDDAYGGTIANRCRFLLEATGILAGVFGADRVGVKLTPSARGNGMIDSDPEITFRKAIAALSSLKIAYVHLSEPSADDLYEGDVLKEVALRFRPYFSGTLIANGGFDRDKGNMLLENNGADLVSFGLLSLANPDLPERFRLNKPLNALVDDNGEGEKGYTDYPLLSAHPYMQLLGENQ